MAEGQNTYDRSNPSLSCGGLSTTEILLQVCQGRLCVRGAEPTIEIRHQLIHISRPTLKGGFLFPGEIRDSQIINETEETVATPAGTCPRRERCPAEIGRSYASSIIKVALRCLT